MEHTPVVSTRKLNVGQEQNSTLLSGQDAVVPCSTMTGTKYSAETALKAALVIIECMAGQMLSRDALYLSLSAARAKKPVEMTDQDYQDFLGQLSEQLDLNRKQNVLSRMF